jgi:hypothetical protein
LAFKLHAKLFLAFARGAKRIVHLGLSAPSALILLMCTLGGFPLAKRRRTAAQAGSGGPPGERNGQYRNGFPENVSRWADVSKSGRRLPDDLSRGFPPPSPPAE